MFPIKFFVEVYKVSWFFLQGRYSAINDKEKEDRFGFKLPLPVIGRLPVSLL